MSEREREKEMMIRTSTVKKGNRPRHPRSINLEFAECWLDPPRYRSAIQVYEHEIEGTHKALKNLVKNIDVSYRSESHFFTIQMSSSSPLTTIWVTKCKSNFMLFFLFDVEFES